MKQSNFRPQNSFEKGQPSQQILLPIYLNYAKYYTVGPPYPQVLHPQIQPTADQNFSLRLAESTGANSTDTESQLYSLLYAILYKGFEHPHILVSAGAPGTKPLQILTEDCISKLSPEGLLYETNTVNFSFPTLYKLTHLSKHQQKFPLLPKFALTSLVKSYFSTIYSPSNQSITSQKREHALLSYFPQKAQSVVCLQQLISNQKMGGSFWFVQR